MIPGRILLNNASQEKEAKAKEQARKCLDATLVNKSMEEIRAGKFCGLDDIIADAEKRIK